MEMHILTHRINTKRKIGSNIHTHFHTSNVSVGMMSTNDINPLFFVNSRFGEVYNVQSIFPSAQIEISIQLLISMKWDIVESHGIIKY